MTRTCSPSARTVEGEGDAGEGGGGAAGRRVLGHAPAAAEHARVEGRALLDDLSGVEVGRRAAVLGPGHSPGRARAIAASERTGANRNGAPALNRLGSCRSKPMSPGSRPSPAAISAADGGVRSSRSGRRGSVEARRRAPRPLPRRTRQTTSPTSSSSTMRRSRAASRSGARRWREEAGRADRRMAGERQLPAGREDADPGRMDGIAGLEDEHGLGEIELARDRLHARVVEARRSRATTASGLPASASRRRRRAWGSGAPYRRLPVSRRKRDGRRVRARSSPER